MKSTKITTSRKKTSRKTVKRKPKIIEHPRSSSLEFTNREIGWLHFNRRVLHQAEDQRTPLLERLRFLAICDSNLDEFFMKRVGGLKRQVAAGISPKSSDGKTPLEQLTAIRAYVQSMLADMSTCRIHLQAELKKQNILILKWNDLTPEEKNKLRDHYKRNIFPVLTPLSVDPGHPFPFISNLSMSFGVALKHPDQEEKLFARVKIPKLREGPWIKIPNDVNKNRFIHITDVIEENLFDLFPSMEVLGSMLFRITRNADLERDDDGADDLLQMIAEELRQRRFADVVRMEHGPQPDAWMLQLLKSELELDDEDIFEHPSELDYSDLMPIVNIDRPDLKYKIHQPVVPLAFNDPDKSIFDIIKANDQLLHHPYESFSATVERFIKDAAIDPKVVAIKMTLYRTGDNSPFVKSLIRAAESGKQVVCLVELKARFDEERNIYWAQSLENAGVHVVYGIVGLKTHAKMALVVRQEEEDQIRCYAHIGTGNYNSATSRVYTDLGLLTCREEITSETVEFFHYLTGRSLKKDYKHLLIAPVNMFSQFKELIHREGENAKAKRPSGIIVKCNNMEENDIAFALYDASKKGVPIQMIIRGFACVRPKHPSFSQNLSVVSTIGRFLEHSRIFYFRNGQTDPVEGLFYIGSADWMYRNLHARVEAIVPIYDRSLREKLWEILQLNLHDRRKNWDMHTDGTYSQRVSNEQGIHEQLIDWTQKRNSLLDPSSE